MPATFPLNAKAVALQATIARYISIIVFLCATIVAIGWCVAPREWWSGIGPFILKPNAAIALAVLSLGLWQVVGHEPTRRRPLLIASAVGVVLLGLATLAEEAWDVNWGIDGLGAASVAGDDGTSRMSPLGAISCVLLGLSLWSLAAKPAPRSIWISQILAAIASFGAFMSMFGYLLELSGLREGLFFATAMPTGVAVFILSVGLMCARPDRGFVALTNATGAGGNLLRMLLPLLVVLPVASRWIEFKAETRAFIPPGFGVVLGAATRVYFSAIVVWVIARILNKEDVALQNAESNIRKGEERHRLITETINEVFWMTDVNIDQILYVSPAYERVWGRSCRSLYEDSRSFFNAIHPEDRPAIMRSMLEEQKAGEPYTHEYRVVRPDGTVCWVSDRGFPVRDANGAIVHYVGVAREITARKRAQEELNLLAEAVESTSEMISITSLDDRFIFVNRAFLEKYGYRREEVIGQTPEILASPEARDSGVRVSVREMALIGGWSGDLINCRKDGTQLPIRLSAGPVRDAQGRVIALIGIAQDITERKQVEELLRANEARFRAIFDHSALGIVIESPEGQYRTANRRFCEMVGYTAEELGTLSFRDLTPEADRAIAVEHQRRLIAGELAICRLEKRLTRKDGVVIWTETTVSLVRRADGAPDYLIVLVEDTTARRSLEAQLRQAQKMEAIGQLAGGVAHDFNNVLTAITGHATLLTSERWLGPTARESLDEIVNAARRAASLTRQLLLFSRQEVFQPRNLDLNDAVTQLSRMLKRLIGEDVNLKTRLHDQPLPIHADPGMIDQVLLNLAVNARDAMPQGGDLTLETSVEEVEPLDAEVIGIAPGRYASLSVTDTGSGIPPEILPRIFEPFFTTKEVGRGTGLGLATVFGIMKQHRGGVRALSVPGHGAAFTAFFPLADATIPVQLNLTFAPAPRGKGEAILLVEDDEPVRIMVAGLLRRNGYTVVAAANGIDALQHWARTSGQFDVLLSDLVMPGGMDGNELAARLEAQRPGLKVIFTSGYSSNLAGRALRLGPGQAFLQKPFSSADLLGTLHKLLSGEKVASPRHEPVRT